MSFAYGQRSTERLNTCRVELQEIMRMAIKFMDLTILCGHRNEAAQNKAYQEENSTVKWPNSRHNSLPAEAVDVAPYPINWDGDDPRWEQMAIVVKGCAAVLGYEIEWGGDWKTLVDKPHFQLKRKKAKKTTRKKK